MNSSRKQHTIEPDNNLAPTSGSPPFLDAIGLSKSFGPLKALDDVSMQLPPGTARALLGGNGAGKSTLVKCIIGTYRPDAGSVQVDGRTLQLRNPREAHSASLGMVYQHFTLVDNMTIVENMVLARGRLPAIIDWQRETDRLSEFMAGMPVRINPRAVVRHLSAGEKQKAEILKQLYLKRRVIILDEPTSVLTPGEADEVLGFLRGLCTEGRLSMLLVTHKLREVMAYCDTFTVLRHGRVTGEGTVQGHEPKDFGKMMMGDDVIPAAAVRGSAHPEASKEARLIIRNLTADNELEVQALQGLNVSVHPYEIVGIAGVSGNGQRELIRILAGQQSATSGEVLVHGEPYRGTREDIRRHRFHVLPEMPLLNACVPAMTVAENLSFRAFDRPPYTWLKWMLNRRVFQARAKDLIARYDIRPGSPDIRMRNLSGGNAQRTVLARELSGEVQVLVAANPCFGLDFRAVADIRSQLMNARNGGGAVLLVSEDLDEIFELSDRILVIFDGKIVYETPAQDADRQLIGRHMAGHPDSGTDTP